jgi:hypothetical protein
MIDIVYVLASVAFFAAMLAYIVACDKLGASASSEEQPKA